MLKVKKMLVILALTLLPTGVMGASTIQCGLKPLTPFGCDARSARCVCDSRGNCQWVFDC